MTAPVPNRWACQWCDHPSPVPSLNADHEASCVARPTDALFDPPVDPRALTDVPF